jgi:thioredoxin-dependent peroxiredoxin
MALEEGKKAPEFALPDEDGNVVRLADFKGKPVVVFFFPKADTPGWTREACDFRDEVELFQKKKAAVVGISRDTPAAQKRFKEKYDLPFPLLSDPESKVHQAWGAWGEKNMYGKKSMGAVRTTVLVGPDGKVARSSPKVKVEGHVAEVLESL